VAAASPEASDTVGMVVVQVLDLMPVMEDG
jgi:hypothetical protein